MAGPTIERVRELLRYDPDTGEFHWMFSRRGAKAAALAGSKNSLGYVQLMVDRRQCLGHRLAWMIHYGRLPTMIDHINGDRSDNRIANLRECTHTQNNGNMKARKNKTGYKGVYSSKDGRYYAQIKIRGKIRSLGYYNDPEKAHDAYFRAAQCHFGEFARAA